jgi:nucleoside-diphosphate-sugar epimerase
MAWVANGPEEIALALPRAHAHVQVVPIDFVVETTHRLAQDPRCYGRRFHLVDEQPPTVEELVVLLAEHCNKRTAPALNALTRGLVSANFRLISDSVRSVFDVQGAEAEYDSSEAQAALAASGLRCPPLESYLPRLLEFARRELFGSQSEAKHVG